MDVVTSSSGEAYRIKKLTSEYHDIKRSALADAQFAKWLSNEQPTKTPVADMTCAGQTPSVLYTLRWILHDKSGVAAEDVYCNTLHAYIVKCKMCATVSFTQRFQGLLPRGSSGWLKNAVPSTSIP